MSSPKIVSSINSHDMLIITLAEKIQYLLSLKNINIFFALNQWDSLAIIMRVSHK